MNRILDDLREKLPVGSGWSNWKHGLMEYLEDTIAEALS
jgi:hypothetical protein